MPQIIWRGQLSHVAGFFDRRNRAFAARRRDSLWKEQISASISGS